MYKGRFKSMAGSSLSPSKKILHWKGLSFESSCAVWLYVVLRGVGGEEGEVETWDFK